MRAHLVEARDLATDYLRITVGCVEKAIAQMTDSSESGSISESTAIERGIEGRRRPERLSRPSWMTNIMLQPSPPLVIDLQVIEVDLERHLRITVPILERVGDGFGLENLLHLAGTEIAARLAEGRFDNPFDDELSAGKPSKVFACTTGTALSAPAKPYSSTPSRSRRRAAAPAVADKDRRFKRFAHAPRFLPLD